MHSGELSPVPRLLLAAAIVFGIPIIGFLLIYSGMVLWPLIVLAVFVALVVKLIRRT